MKKQKKFADLNSSDASTKHTELVKELVKFRVSMDPALISNAGGIAGLRRDLKIVSRKKAQSAK
ncbi:MULTISPECIES: hypothetical protein [Fluviispira]|uniref:50S ribosomal protein L29 n=1 Tax=Fluviispira sanaruensis TaxID=2493639 RepID=A0A4P2VLX0_FLUSA|nr:MULTISPECIES: hypothetical protein [Fluviispira]BBH53901.1 hypothetical protein JCM31447_23540 [Fluviispira sanaruensis]